MPTHEEIVEEEKQMFRQQLLKDPDVQDILFRVLDSIEEGVGPVEYLSFFMSVVETYAWEPMLQANNVALRTLIDELMDVHERYRPSALMAAIMIVKAFKEVPPPLPTPCNSEDDE